MTKLIVDFRNFANAPNNWVIYGNSFIWSTPEHSSKKMLPGSLAFKDLIQFIGAAVQSMLWPLG
jgi:hypothetical protein